MSLKRKKLYGKTGYLGAGEIQEIARVAKTGTFADFEHLVVKFARAGMGQRALKEVASEYCRQRWPETEPKGGRG